MLLLNTLPQLMYPDVQPITHLSSKIAILLIILIFSSSHDFLKQPAANGALLPSMTALPKLFNTHTTLTMPFELAHTNHHTTTPPHPNFPKQYKKEISASPCTDLMSNYLFQFFKITPALHNQYIIGTLLIAAT